ncbi:hypothetical protein NliqN6_0880 [Naganishia liquefaciens]|uniref:LIM zinc-binding domain-containing protein n=1 Tax=Naganishia liquefaciens TaxID=104408 RepID=A0A8H3TNW4_9TREE|nr:hypothetical protein NliqN6_0880 [Naganishia liquefaciens]
MLGATPRCAACGQLAYHAEQVMGPARKIYHKPCLQCTQCRKRLDPGSLVEHEAEPFCRRCHGLLFGTRDLRSANVFAGSGNAPPVTPPRGKLWSASDMQRDVSPGKPINGQAGGAEGAAGALHLRTGRRPSIDDHQAVQSTTDHSATVAPPVEPTAKRPLPPLPPKPASMSVSKHGGIPQDHHPTTNSPTRPSNPTVTSSEALPSNPPPHDPPAKAYTSIDDLLQAETYTTIPSPPSSSAPTNPPHRNPLLARRTPMPARASPSGNESCARCNKTVYFAEGVNAIGQRWHRGCLRCTACRTSLDPGKVQDRDAMPYCRNCYTKEFGPGVLR